MSEITDVTAELAKINERLVAMKDDSTDSQRLRDWKIANIQGEAQALFSKATAALNNLSLKR